MPIKLLFKKDIGRLGEDRPCKAPVDIEVSLCEGRRGEDVSLQGSALKPWVMLESQSHFCKRESDPMPYSQNPSI